jgi:hypothetical protein
VFYVSLSILENTTTNNNIQLRYHVSLTVNGSKLKQLKYAIFLNVIFFIHTVRQRMTIFESTYKISLWPGSWWRAIQAARLWYRSERETKAELEPGSPGNMGRP